LDYSLADVVRMSGGKRRSVQLWAEAGAIKAFARTDKRGTGTHRRFSREEAIIACCLNGLARRQVGIGELIRIGKGLRKFLNNENSRKEVESAIAWKGTGEPLLFIIWDEDREPQILLPDEPEFINIISPDKAHSLTVLLPLRRCLAGLRA
jgi:hypothetical protein